MDYRMDFLSSREKDSLYAKYGTYPGWHSSQTYEHSPSTTAYLQYLSDYGEPNTCARNNMDNIQTETSSTTRVPSQSKLSHRELYDYVDGVRNLVPDEKQRSDLRNYKEQDICAHCEGWESTWQTKWRGKTDHVGSNTHSELQAYINRYHHTLPKKTPGFEAEDWRSSRCSSDFEKLLGFGQCVETRSQPTSVSSHKRDHSNEEIEHWSKWSPWDSRNMKSLFPVESFRRPPSYTAPPAYSSPKDGYKLAGIPKVSGQAFPEQTFENRNVNFTETSRNPSANNGQCLQNNNQIQNIERYYSEITGGQKQTVSVMQYTAIKTKPSSHSNLQYPEFTQMTYCDSTQKKKTKPLRRKGGETVFCLVSRMGEVSGLSSSPEEPLKSHVLPLLNDIKSNNGSVATKQTTQSNDDSRQNQNEYLKREEQESGCFMFRGHGNTVLGHNGEDQQPNYIQDLSNVVNPDKNKQDVQWIDSWSGCLTQKSSIPTDSHEKPCREIIDKFPLWKEPKYQSHSTDLNEEPNRQHQEIINKSNVTNIEDNNNSTNDQSLVIIDATCVVVKVELVHLPEKEHVQYVCLTETEGPFSSTSKGNDDQEQESSVLLSQESPENSTVDARAKGMIEGADEHHRTGKGVLDEPDSSWDSYAVGRIKEIDESTVEAREELDNELMVGQPGDGTTLPGNNSLEVMLNIMKAEDQTTAKPEAGFEDLGLTKAEPTSEDFEDTTETIKHMKEINEQENRPILDESDCVNAETMQDDKINQKDASKDLAQGKTEDSLSDEIDGQGEHNLDNSTTLNSNKIVLPSTVGKGTTRRSSSSPHLSIYSSVLETPHLEDESWLLSSSTNTEDSQCSVSPSVRSSRTNSLSSLPSSPIPDVVHNSSLPQTRSEPDDVLLCTSIPSEHNIKIQHAMSLRDAVSRIRKHTAPDSETEDEEVDECGDQTEGVSIVYKHTVLDSEAEVEKVNEAAGQSKGVNCKHTVLDSETEEAEVNEQSEEVNGFHEHTAPDPKTEEESGDRTDEVNCIYKHIAPDSETEEEEVNESHEQIEGIIRIHTAFYSETDVHEVHESGDQTEGVSLICKQTAHVSEDKVEEVNESGDQTKEVHFTCKNTAFHSKTEEEDVNESLDQTEEVNCTCKHINSYFEEEKVNEFDEQTESISHIHKHTAFDFEEESGDQTEGVGHICKHTVSEEDEVNGSDEQTEKVNCVCKYAATESKKEKEVGECGDQPEEESTDLLHQSLYKEDDFATSVSSLVEGNTECELLLL